MKMKLLKGLLLALACMLATAANLDPVEMIQEEGGAPVINEFVYIQQSKVGTLAQNDRGYYTLTLKGNNLDIIYFADQPNRFAGQQELTPFFEAWTQSAHKDSRPPTAFLNYTVFNPNKEEGVTPDILQLRNPKYDRENDTLTFEVMPLHEYPIKEGAFENVVIVYDKE